MAAILQTTLYLSSIFVNENVCIMILSSAGFVLKWPVENKSVWVQVMDYRWSGNE